MFKGSVQVGYFRLRHGGFTASFPECSGAIVYEAEPEGDGMFEDNEREKYLTNACIAINACIAMSVELARGLLSWLVKPGSYDDPQYIRHAVQSTTAADDD